ncbi:MAG TPA: 2OG-Fe(II) oxygenase [Caulobacteraceae bacterium]|nr:2OG-Fe(II) oxygenase [Caulobacteraceae bacterium]
MGSPSAPARRTPLGFGEPVPFFCGATDGNPRYSLEATAGRWMVLMAFGALSHAASFAAHAEAMAARDLFDDVEAAFFGVSVDGRDRARLQGAPRGFRYFWDEDQAICRRLGLTDGVHLEPAIFLIDRAFRIVLAEPIGAAAVVLQRLRAELAAEASRSEAPHAPVLMLPRIFEPDLCAELIAHFEAHQATASGFAVDMDGRTVNAVDASLKRRQDVTIADAALIAAVEARLRKRLLPMVKRAFNWQATEIERFLICRYGEEDGGFFFAHRDDATAGTAHRKFAVTVNLDAEAYEGGDLRFREFSPRAYRPPTGGACVFCCSLLHEVTPVTRGARHAFVPFLYDEAGSRVRRAYLAASGTAAPNRRDRRGARRRG